jgi:hypothetical protein
MKEMKIKEKKKKAFMKIWFNFDHSKVLGYNFLTFFEVKISQKCLLVHVTPHISQLLHGI